jgi:hypothetical protein
MKIFPASGNKPPPNAADTRLMRQPPNLEAEIVDVLLGLCRDYKPWKAPSWSGKAARGEIVAKHTMPIQEGEGAFLPVSALLANFSCGAVVFFLS